MFVSFVMCGVGGREGCNIPDLKLAGLVVGAVGAGDELLVLALEGEPGLEIVLLGGSVVERTRDNANNAVGKAEGLVELLGSVDHLVEVSP